MKRLNYILTILLGSLLLAACSQEPTEESSVESQGNLKIDIDTRAGEGVDGKEKDVATVRVIVFGKQGNWLGRVTCNQSFTLAQLTGGTTTPLIKVRSGLSDIFMVLNEASYITSAESGVRLDNITSRAQFDALKIQRLGVIVGTIAMPMLQSFPDVTIKPYPQTTTVGGAGATGAERLAVKLMVTIKSEVPNTQLVNTVLENFNGYTGMKPVDAADPAPLRYSRDVPLNNTAQSAVKAYVPESWVLQLGSTAPVIQVTTTIGGIPRVDRYKFETQEIFDKKLFARNSATTINFTIKPRSVEVTTQVKPWGKRSDDINVGDDTMKDEVKMTTTVEDDDAPVTVTDEPIIVAGAGTRTLKLRVVENTKTNIEYTTADGATVSKVLSPDHQYITLTVRSKYTDWAIHPAVDNIATVTIKQGNTTKTVRFNYRPHVIARFTTGNLVQKDNVLNGKVGQPLDGGFFCLYGSANGYPWHDWNGNGQNPVFITSWAFWPTRKNHASIVALPEGRRGNPRGWETASLITDHGNAFFDICNTLGEYRTPTAKEFMELIWGPTGTPDANLKASALKEIRNGGGALLGWAVGPNRESVTFSGGAILNADDPIKNGALFLPAAGHIGKYDEAGSSGMGAYMTSSSAATGSNIYRLYLSTGNSGVYSQGSDNMGVLRCIRK